MSGRAILGIVLVVAGLGILAERAELLDFGGIVSTWWPMILIGIGAMKLLGGAWMGGFVLIVVGVLFQARELGVLPGGFFEYFWPVVLILLGVWLIASRTRRGTARVANEDCVSHFVAFGGLEARNESARFEGGSVTALFGGANLDLTGAKLAGERAVLDALAMFGGVEIRVPVNWNVVTSGTPVLGGWENKTRHEAPPGETSPTLEVKGLAIFGGVEIKN